MISSAMLNGHSGSMSTGHANNPTDMLHRLETMMLMGIDLPLAAVQRQIASALDIIIHLGRLRDKSRKVLQITEIEKYESGKIHTRTLYEFRLQDIKKHEYLIGLAKSTVIFGLILYLFYESFLPGIILFPVWGFYMKEWLEEMTDKKEEEFRVQFKDSIQIMAGALKAGYSAENAIRETCHDLKPMYKSESRIIKECEIMIRKLKIHIPVGQVLSEFAENVEQVDVDNFVTVFTTAQKSGGDSIVIIKDAVKVISEKMETEKEIQTMIASKKLEFEIMSMIPFGMIGYMKLTFGDFLKVLYGNPAGIIVMSICLALYFTAYIWGKKMIKIEV